MKSKLDTLSSRYDSALRDYVVADTPANGSAAIELGRRMIVIGLEMLELARIHDHALQLVMNAPHTAKARANIVKRARLFLAEAMKPIETAHRAALEGKVNLDRRSAELAASNCQLKLEIARRTEAEEALREKERYVRDLLNQSLQMQAHLRQLTRDLLSAQEEERRTISRELHDDIAQTLTGINVHLAKLKMEASADVKGLARKIASTQLIVRKSVEIVHQFARSLRPTMLDDLGLIPALTAFIKEFTKRSGIPVGFTAFVAIEQLSSVKRTVVYRMIQSALTNVAQHAQARHVKVSIYSDQDCACVEVKDDGKSFQVHKAVFVKKRKRLGLLGMRERVEMVGGSFSVESEPGHGTSIRARIPFSKGMKVQS